MKSLSEKTQLNVTPDKTGLIKIHDNRSGKNLEIVIPVFNEELRISNILRYYKEFDIVLLDGGSTDRTIEMAIQSGASIYKRVGEHFGENHFVFYNNTLSKSGYCFYMMADHYIEIDDLRDAFMHLKSKDSVIYVRVIEWFYGQNPKAKLPNNFGLARGFRKGTAAFDPHKFHDSLHFLNNSNELGNIFVYDLHHLHVRSIKIEYGKLGRYLDTEVRQFLQKKATSYKYIRRFIIPLIMFAFYRVFFNKLTPYRKILKIMELAISAQIAFANKIEQKYMPTIDEQTNIYSSIYRSKPK